MKTAIITKTSRLIRALLVTSLLFAGAAQAQTYTKTETISYYDNTTKWVVGQTAKVTCIAASPASTGCDGNSGNGSDVVSETTFDLITAMPLTTAAFGKPQSTMTYNVDGTLATVKDGLNKTTTLADWKRGIPQTITFADGKLQKAWVDDNGWISWVTSEVNSKTCYGYDAMGRLTSITYPSETSGGVCDTSRWAATNRSLVPVASIEYGIPAGHWRETTTTGNATKISYYDGLWRPLLTREYDAANVAGTERFSKRTYDFEGRATFASYPSNTSAPTTGVWTFYDALGRVTSSSQDSEQDLLTSWTTYNMGFTTTVTYPLGNSATTTYLTYDQPSTDLPLVITAQESATTTISRDTFGKPTALVRSGGGSNVTRSYAYNGYQELCRTIEPETGATLFGYDNAGNLTWSAAGVANAQACSALGTESAIAVRKVSRTYDLRNRLTNLAFPDGNGNQSLTYYDDGLTKQVTTANSGNSVTNAYTYNNRRLLTGESMVPDTLQLGWAMGYGYNSLGQVITETSPGSVSVNYSVNALGQTTLVSASADGSAATSVASNASYYPNGGLKQFTYGNGIVHTMTQNARQLPSRSTDGTVLDLSMAFDKNGNVISVTDYINAGVNNQSKSMVYDNLDRLTSATSPMFGTASYTYDTLDNLKRVSVTGGNRVRDHTYVYNANNVLTNVQETSNGTSVIGLTYDAQGNLANKNGVTTTFDFGNRLRSTAGVTYRYDAQGRRVRLDNAGGSLKYSFYSQDGRLVWQRDEPASKRISNLYLAGSVVAELSRPIGSGTVTLSYYHTDALGSPIAKTNASGSVLEKTKFEPYGLMDRPNDDRVGFTGHVMDSASGLTYMQQRYYDPQIGRFLSVDPVTADTAGGTNFNRYWYANNNPYRFMDPDGREAKSDNSLCRTPGNPCTITKYGGYYSPEAKEARNNEAKAIAKWVGGPFFAATAHLADGENWSALFEAAMILPVARGLEVFKFAGEANTVAKRGITVLGHSPAYKELAGAIPSRSFQIPNWIWNRSPQLGWAANARFLDRVIARGDEVYLATNARKAAPGSIFARELQYMSARGGYTVTDDGWRLLPPIP